MQRLWRIGLVLAVISVAVSLLWAGTDSAHMPKGFTYVDDLIPHLVVELRYCTDDNFVGERIDGYLKPRCILTRQAGEALNRVQGELKRYGLGLKIYDAYRPQKAVDHFVRWAKDPDDTKMKRAYYPCVQKEDLFKEGYIARRSGHSRGSTVDLTIVSLDEKGGSSELDMGTPFDFFGPESWSDHPHMSPARRAHRLLLRTLMEKHGFKHYSKEWWHFSLKNEPYPNTYFDFPVQ